MKTFKNIQEWVASNPTKEEMTKVMVIVNRAAITQTRREIAEKEKDLRKLDRSSKVLSKIDIKVPKELTDRLTNVQKEIAELRKGLPEIKKRVKKEEK